VLNYDAGTADQDRVVRAAFLLSRAQGGGLAGHAARRRKHHSPNAGWPEAAIAGALGIALAGRASMTAAEPVDDAWMGAGGHADAGSAAHPARLEALRSSLCDQAAIVAARVGFVGRPAGRPALNHTCGRPAGRPY
jgi:cobalamin biosynthesis protein CobD/CbiB